MAILAGVIAEHKFPTQQIAAASAGITLITESNIKGELLEVVSSFNGAGSLALATSGLPNRDIWRRNASSGANPIVSYPSHLYEDVGGSGAGFGTPTPFIMNDRLILTTGSLASGTAATLDITVRYRQ